MPRLDDTHLIECLTRQIDRLTEGKDIILRDIKAALSPISWAQVEADWKQQKLLREGKRVRTDEERAANGVLSKRDLYLSALKADLKRARDDAGAAWAKKMQDANVRQARIYFDALNQAEKEGKTEQSAMNFANNELTRAGLRRMDREVTNHKIRRDVEVQKMEDELRERLKTKEESEHERLMVQQDALDSKLRTKGGRKKKTT